jgi:hypothetical protein
MLASKALSQAFLQGLVPLESWTDIGEIKSVGVLRYAQDDKS